MYDETLRAEDWDMWLRLSRKYKFYFTNHYDSVYRIVPSSLSNNAKNHGEIYFAYCKTLLKHLNYSPAGNRNIARNIQIMSPVVYKYNGENSSELLRKNFFLNKNLKSFLLFVASYAGIPYNFYETLKFRKKPS
jgi:hypothetical protein